MGDHFALAQLGADTQPLDVQPEAFAVQVIIGRVIGRRITVDPARIVRRGNVALPFVEILFHYRDAHSAQKRPPQSSEQVVDLGAIDLDSHWQSPSYG